MMLWWGRMPRHVNRCRSMSTLQLATGSAFLVLWELQLFSNGPYSARGHEIIQRISSLYGHTQLAILWDNSHFQPNFMSGQKSHTVFPWSTPSGQNPNAPLSASRPELQDSKRASTPASDPRTHPFIQISLSTTESSPDFFVTIVRRAS